MFINALRAVAALLCTLSLWGCAKIVTDDALKEYEKSVREYRWCLSVYGNNVQACEGKRLSMEATERYFKNMAPSGSANNVNVQNR